MEERRQDQGTEAGSGTPQRTSRCALILVDFSLDDDRAAEHLDTLLARWGQSVRYSITNSEPRVTTGSVRGHVMTTTSDAILAAMVRAHEVLSHE